MSSNPPSPPPTRLPQFKPHSWQKNRPWPPGLPRGTPEAERLAEALPESHDFFPQQRTIKMILPPIRAESPGSKNTIQEMRNEMKHREKVLGIF